MKESLLFKLGFWVIYLYGQCCSPNPVAGTSSIGTLTHGTLRTIFIYRHSYFEKYLLGDKPFAARYLNYAGYDLLSSIFSVGVLPSFTVDLEAGYYIRNYEELNLQPPELLKGKGFTDGALMLKYALFQRSQTEITLGAGGSIPLSKPIYINNVRLPQSLQPSNFAPSIRGVLFFRYNVLDQLRMFLIHQTLYWGENDVGFKKESSQITSLFLTYNLTSRWIATLVLRSDYRGRQRFFGVVAPATGGYTL